MWNFLRNALALLGVAGICKALYDKGVEDGQEENKEKTTKKTTTKKGEAKSKWI